MPRFFLCHLKILPAVPRLFVVLSLLLSAGVLAGCCGAVSCDCQDERDDALFFRYSTDTTGTGTGFRAAEVDTVVVVRYVHPDDATTAGNDTVRLVRPRATAAATPVIIDNATPFAVRSGRKLSAYRYALLLPGRQRLRPVQRDTISGIELQGKLDSDGCCTCYQNTTKSLLVNRQRVDAHDPTSQDEPVEVELRRR
ncbi:hypothetical protein F0P96_13300 [Hymenobacter busanensis]|uniref:Uncharacterized protein n=1 Tax=Hymenobacter busanensis TaxID=2607656 RepID=A0A7L4ZUS2_9BACT|nr:hypothetical protein [Hymenobacter busanensis]KAA9332443.1 hypothetical protein F0P96_13300 [Hymenobacter busanensis]QHJ07219.1 hypothetical protein GUY19_07970 [Hymenobacter busanensis]